MSTFCFFSNILANFANRIKSKDIFEISMNRATEICHNILLSVVRKIGNFQYLTKCTFFCSTLYVLHAMLFKLTASRLARLFKLWSSSYTLQPTQFKLCSSSYALQAKLFKLCSYRYALTVMLFKLCSSSYALQAMLFKLCSSC